MGDMSGYSKTSAALLTCVIFFLSACASLANDMFSRILQPIRPGVGSFLSAAGSATDSASAADEDMGLYRWRIFWLESRADSPRAEWFYSLSYSGFEIDGGLELPDTGIRIEDPLQDIEAGLGYRAMRGKDVYGLFSSLGSASDKPFDSYDETSLMLNAFYNMYRTPQSSWLLLVNYSNRRSFLNNIPIPGAAYVRAPDRRTLMIIGMPFLMLRYPLGDRFDVSLRYFVPDQFELEGSYKLARGCALLAGADRNEDSYFLADRQDADNHLYYEETRLYSGIKWSTRSGTTAKLTVGYALDRRFYQGEDDDSELDRVGVDDAADIIILISHRF